MTVAHCDEMRFVHQDEREPTLEAGQHPFEGQLEVPAVGA